MFAEAPGGGGAKKEGRGDKDGEPEATKALVFLL